MSSPQHVPRHICPLNPAMSISRGWRAPTDGGQAEGGNAALHTFTQGSRLSFTAHNTALAHPISPHLYPTGSTRWHNERAPLYNTPTHQQRPTHILLRLPTRALESRSPPSCPSCAWRHTQRCTTSVLHPLSTKDDAAQRPRALPRARQRRAAAAAAGVDLCLPSALVLLGPSPNARCALALRARAPSRAPASPAAAYRRPPLQHRGAAGVCHRHLGARALYVAAIDEADEGASGTVWKHLKHRVASKSALLACSSLQRPVCWGPALHSLSSRTTPPQLVTAPLARSPAALRPCRSSSPAPALAASSWPCRCSSRASTCRSLSAT